MVRSSIWLTVFFSFTSILAFGQLGTIRGSIKDALTGDPIIGANIYLAASTQGTAADIEGNFEISHVKSGIYDVVVSFISYRTDTLRKVTVYPDQITVIHTALTEESQQLAEVVVSTNKMNDTDISVLSDIRTSQLVVSGISAQQISLSQDRDAAQIVRRIPGVTVLNNRFVNVRGLSERYSTVLFNGVIAPSTEVDTRAFAFDLVPSSMIDRMMVYKAGAPYLPGDFAGAVIDITTRGVLDNSVSVNVTAGYRAGTTFGDFNTERGSSTDWLGYDNGYRSLPSSFPTKNLREYNLSLYNHRKVVSQAGVSLNNDWEPIAGQAAPDIRTTINFSRSAFIGKKRIGNITSISYSNTRQRLEQTSNFYEAYDDTKPDTKVGQRYGYHDFRDMYNVRLGAISNFIFELNPRHKFEFRNLINQQGSSAVTARTGLEDVTNNDVSNVGLNYTQRFLYSGQLMGQHALTDNLSINWVGGYSQMNSDQPDYRRMRSQRSIGLTDPFSIVVPPSANSVDGRFFSDLTETVMTGALNVDYKLNPDADEKNEAKISLGYYASYAERDFAARWFSFNWAPGQSPILELMQQSFNNIYTEQTLYNAEDSPSSPSNPVFFLTEGTVGSDSYKGTNLYNAGYINLYKAFGSLKIAAGVRTEYNRQQLDSDTTHVDNPITSILPFMNLAFDVSEKSRIRATYSKTVNRPNFRELAPFNYYDFDRNANFYGNPDLKTATIHNVDLSWAYYPSKSESVTLGVFYKNFINPIEYKLQQGSNIIYTTTNAEAATSMGVELEARKSLNGLTSSTFLDRTSLVLNAALIESKVTFGNDATNQDKERAMQGQSPYIVNAGLYYDDYESGLQFNVSYNVFGKRIFVVGDYNEQSGVSKDLPTQYEMPRNQIDVTVSKDLGSRFNVKLGIQDILNQKYRIIQDTNSDRKITGYDDSIQEYRPGQYVTLGFTYKVN